MALVLACGSEQTATPTPEPTATPEPTGKTLEQAAEERSGGLGAFYLGDGDFSLLVGPAPAEGLGDADDMVNLAGLEREGYLFDSQYYQNLVENRVFRFLNRENNMRKWRKELKI